MALQDAGGSAGIRRENSRSVRRPQGGGRFRSEGHGAQVPHGLPTDVRFNSLYQDQRGSLWVETTDRRLYRQQGERFVASPVRGYAPAGACEMTLAFEDRRGDIWVATRNGNLSSWHDGEIRIYTTREGLSSNQVETAFKDREGNLWFGRPYTPPSPQNSPPACYSVSHTYPAARRDPGNRSHTSNSPGHSVSY